jgi:hypothetical protein
MALTPKELVQTNINASPELMNSLRKENGRSLNIQVFLHQNKKNGFFLSYGTRFFRLTNRINVQKRKELTQEV